MKSPWTNSKNRNSNISKACKPLLKSAMQAINSIRAVMQTTFGLEKEIVTIEICGHSILQDNYFLVN